MRFISLLASLLLVLSAAQPAHAITGKFVDDFEHPFVGLAVFYDEQGEFIGRCSGSLLSPTLFLTAGHCIEGADSARVYFQQGAGANFDPVTELDPVTGYPETCLSQPCTTSSELINYGYPAGFPNTRDAALLILDDPILLSEYGVLAEAGSLDALATRRGRQAIDFTVSGYGLSYTNPAKTISFRERLMASSRLVNLRSALTGGFNLQTTNNPGVGGGTCFGDSGGPVFYGGFSSNIIVGVTSFGLSSQVCAGVDFAYRTDQQELIDFILANTPEGEMVTIVEL
ncbi:trypsin-like serine protease [Steroidobacter sp. S1-65]|uniref:Trypsin-like serine protease n=1 Tax=Steroidobacter gossypii TaxID=2805490 RepID=A0ABS1WYH6_9GAMM|nr:trypsin-like serine protease [Steroidobacter gossypii]MBM0106031.1 trypsin-like serine protease [Steroidobacter gossypii]